MNQVRTCPYCNTDIPLVLFDAHVGACDENPDTSSDGSLLIRHPSEMSDDDFDDELPQEHDEDPDENISAPLPSAASVEADEDSELFGDLMDQITGAPPPDTKFESEVDDEFMKLVGQLEITPAVIDVNVATLSDLELSKRFNEVKQELLERGEMIETNTQTGRDLHSQRAAYLIELRKRGLQ